MYENMTLHGWYFMGFHALMWGFWLLIIILIVWVLISLFRNPDPGKKQPPTAREILDIRYAKGEIDRDEYHRLRQDIDTGAH